ncbi:alkane 1-monooxygenase [Thioclava sp. FR2]|uniref:alkane 1-monooxygenase n=1 Tax=Thioclava sp. FR2 TaxID=3445780 RepID=UPI003EBB91AE
MNRRPLPLALFALVALTPVPLILAGIWLGEGWVWAGFLYMSVLVIAIDQMIPYVAGDAPDGSEFPASDSVLLAVGLSHLWLFPLAVWAVAGESGLTPGGRTLVFLAAGYWMGQVAHPAAHELIHRGNRWLFWLGGAIYTSLLIGHHSSAHRLVHHRTVATEDDPSSAPAGMGFWQFAPRSWIGSFRAGWAAEDALRARRSKNGVHPYHAYIGGAALSLTSGWILAGPVGVLAWFGLAAHAQLQMALADYVQHYGLRRARREDGRYEPVANCHSWNTPHWFSSALMLNAPRHSDHHAHPARPYPALRLPDDAPMLPWPLPLACAIAMVPRLWKRRMKPHVAKWSG